MQETLVKAWDKQASFQPGTNLKAWLFTILRNEFYSQMRKRGREVQDSDGAMTARLAIHPAQHGMLDLEDFRKALQLLPEDQREAIILIGASGFSYEEAAEICGCAVGTIKSRVSRARSRLQEVLEISGEADYGPDAIATQVMGSSVRPLTAACSSAASEAAGGGSDRFDEIVSRIGLADRPHARERSLQHVDVGKARREHEWPASVAQPLGERQGRHAGRASGRRSRHQSRRARVPIRARPDRA